MEKSSILYAEALSNHDPVDRISLIEEKLEILLKENTILKKDNERLIDGMKQLTHFTNGINTYHWIKLDKVCLSGADPTMDSREPFSGELTDEITMKQNYWACYISEDKRCYYTPAKWKYIISSLVPVPLDKEENSTFYIRIPKIDMENNKVGLGPLIEYDGKHYHGLNKITTVHHLGDDRRDNRRGISVKINENGHKFIIRRGPLRNVGFDRAMTDSCRSILPYIGLCDNIQIPVEYYCTNCKCIEEGIGFKMYLCLGH